MSTSALELVNSFSECGHANCAAHIWYLYLRRASRILAGALVAVTLAATTVQANAEEGVTANAIVISRVIALDGPAGAKGREQEQALQAYFGAVNTSGGIHGRKVVLRTTNEDLRTEEAMRRINEEQRPFVLFLFGGTVGSTLAMNYGTAHKIPFVAPNSGASVFHHPLNRLVFNTRARYQDEVVAAVRHFATIGQQRLALIHVDDAFGQDAAQGYKDGIRLTGVHSVYEGAFRSDKPDFSKHLQALVEKEPQAVICIGSSKRIAELITLARQSRLSATFMTLSNNSSAGFVRELGPYTRGVMVSQIAPPPGLRTKQISNELRELLANKPDAEVSYAAMEAYVAAKVLTEGLRRAGPTPTREGLVLALETMRRLDMGGIEMDYSRTQHTGSNYVELSILTTDGKFLR